MDPSLQESFPPTPVQSLAIGQPNVAGGLVTAPEPYEGLSPQLEYWTVPEIAKSFLRWHNVQRTSYYTHTFAKHGRSAGCHPEDARKLHEQHNEEESKLYSSFG